MHQECFVSQAVEKGFPFGTRQDFPMMRTSQSLLKAGRPPITGGGIVLRNKNFTDFFMIKVKNRTVGKRQRGVCAFGAAVDAQC